MTTKEQAKAARGPQQLRAAVKRTADEVKSAGQITRAATREWVKLGDVRVNPEVQREFVPAKATAIAARFNPELFKIPVVNRRDGYAWVVDGQHRIEGLKIWLGDGWENQLFEADVYDGLSAADEAELFLGLNDAMAVNAFNKFRVAVVAGRPDESAVARIVTEQGLTISRDPGATEYAVKAVGTLLKVYRAAGPVVLARTLAILRDAYGVPGLQQLTVAGLANVIQRYGDGIDDNLMVERLQAAFGGVGGVLNKAERARKETGNPKTFCVSAAFVDTFNGQAKRGAPRLVSWWKNNA